MRSARLINSLMGVVRGKGSGYLSICISIYSVWLLGFPFGAQVAGGFGRGLFLGRQLIGFG